MHFRFEFFLPIQNLVLENSITEGSILHLIIFAVMVNILPNYVDCTAPLFVLAKGQRFVNYF